MDNRARLSLRDRVLFARLTNQPTSPEEMRGAAEQFWRALSAHGEAFRAAMRQVEGFARVHELIGFAGRAAEGIERRREAIRTSKVFKARGGLW